MDMFNVAKDHAQRRPSMLPSGADRGRSESILVREQHLLNLMERLPDKVLLHIFSYLHHRDLLRVARVCKKWRLVAYDSRLWRYVSLRPDYNGLQITNLEALLAIISVRMGPSLRYMELPMELLTPTVLHELANKCPNLNYLTLDFSTAMQLHDFNDLHAFPAHLKNLCICLSEVIFMEGFMRKIYGYISSVQVLHLIGTYEKLEEEEEVYEVINIHKLKSYVPNLKVVNLYGVTFVDDSHIDALASSCVQLECLALNFCIKYQGKSLKSLLGRCKKIRSLQLLRCDLRDAFVQEVVWEKTNVVELDVSSTELSSKCLADVLTRIPHLTYLAVAYNDGMTDTVLEEMMNKSDLRGLQCLDMSSCENLTDVTLLRFVNLLAPQLRGLMIAGHPDLLEAFWTNIIPKLKLVRILVMGMPEGCCSKITTKVHIDQYMDCICNNCYDMERLEVRWDTQTMRFSDKSSKFIDLLRLRCHQLRSLVLSDGPYFEMVKSNFERADRGTVVRTSTKCTTSIVHLSQYYKDLLFN